MHWPYKFPTEREALEDRLLSPGRPETVEERLQYLVGLLNFGHELAAANGNDAPNPYFERLEREGNERLIAWSRWCRERRRDAP